MESSFNYSVMFPFHSVDELYEWEETVCWKSSDYDAIDTVLSKSESCQIDNYTFEEQFRRCLYWGDETDRPTHKLNATRFSLPMIEVASEITNDLSQSDQGNLDVKVATAFSRSACLSTSAFVISLIYIERLRQSNPAYLSEISPQDLFIISMMVATKFACDSGTTKNDWNYEWAHVVDYPVELINQLEIDFCLKSDWKFFVTDEEFVSMLRELEAKVALRQSSVRKDPDTKGSWMTYTDLSCLLSAGRDLVWLEALSSMISDVIQTFIACAAVYTTTVAVSTLAVFSAGVLSLHMTTSSTQLSDGLSAGGGMSALSHVSNTTAASPQVNCSPEPMVTVSADFVPAEEENDSYMYQRNRLDLHNTATVDDKASIPHLFPSLAAKSNRLNSLQTKSTHTQRSPSVSLNGNCNYTCDQCQMDLLSSAIIDDRSMFAYTRGTGNSLVTARV